MTPHSVAKLSSLKDRDPTYALVGEVDLVVVRWDDEVSVMYGRCLHRGALMSDGYVDGKNLICGLHYWDYRLDSGVSEYNNHEVLPKFESWIDGDDIIVDADEIKAWGRDHPQPFDRDAYLGLYADTSHGTAEEPHNGLIQNYAKSGLSKTGTGGHLPGSKVQGKIAEVRGIEPGVSAISPPRFPDWDTPAQIKDFADEVRDRTGGIPIGYKLSAQHIERDIDAALEVGVDYIILDGRGGGTGAAPVLFRDNISVPTIPALARARQHLDRTAPDVSLVITGGLRKPGDFIKALAMGADAIALSNAPMQAIGCIAMRACHTNNCPVGIATEKPHLVNRLVIEKSARQLANFFEATTELMQVMARACGHSHLSQFGVVDLTTRKKDMSDLSGVAFGGVG